MFMNIFTISTLTTLGILCLPALAEQTRQPIPPGKVPEGLQKSDWQSIHAAHNAWKHEFRQVDGKWQAHNPGQRWTTTFDERGFLAMPQEAEWTWGLELVSYGFAANPNPVSGTAESSAVGQKLTYRWQGGLEEWYVNDGRGLEHGYTIAKRPEAARDGEPLVFTIATRGTLKPGVSSDAQTVHFRDEVGAPILNYSGLKVWDAEGKILASRFAAAEGDYFRLLVEETGAKYPLTIDPIAQQAYLKARNSGGDDFFGESVAISGDTVGVGANGEDSSKGGVNITPNESAVESGAAYVFVRNGTTWSQQAYLKASNTGMGDRFGASVAVSGDTVVVGAYGESSSTTGVDSTSNNNALGSGAAYVFVRNGTTWSEQAYLKASNAGAGDNFGRSVAVSGDTVVVGADEEDSSTTGVNSTPDDNAEGSGAVYMFVRNGTTWSQQAYLKASNTRIYDKFGFSVSASGDTVVVGALQESSSTTGVNSTPDNNAKSSGAAYVFVRNGTTWSQQAYLKASNTGAGDAFGRSVAVSGDTVVVGADREKSSTTGVNSAPNDNSNDAGAAYVFVRNATTWSQQAYLKASNTAQINYFGCSVEIAGETVVVGSFLEGSGTGPIMPDDIRESGAAYVFVRNGTVWSQQAYLKASNSQVHDFFGVSVAVSLETVVVGASGEDSSTTGVNSTPDENARDSGAAYIFTGFGLVQTPPVIRGRSISAIADTSATLGGNVIGAGGGPFSGRGVVYSPASTNANPVIGGAGVIQASTSGTTGAFSVEVSSLTPSTTYAFRAYASNSNGTSYTQVGSFTTSPYILTTTATDGTIQRDPELPGYAAGTTITLTALPASGFVFHGWSGDISGTDNPTAITMDGHKSVSAVFLPSPAGALDTSLAFVLGGNAKWIGQTTTTHDGVDAAESGTIGHNEESWMETSVNGPGQLGFWWRVSSEDEFDGLEFYINGALHERISGNSGAWAQKTIALGNGENRLRWRYAKDFLGDNGSDKGWVDEVVYTSAASLAFNSAMTRAGLTGADALPTATPQGDGVNNLLKYAFNMNASARDVRGLVPGTGTRGLPSITSSLSGDTTILRVEFIRRINGGLIYTPKRSNDLTNGSWTEFSDTPTITPINAMWERVVYEEPLPTATTPHCFGRVEVVLP